MTRADNCVKKAKSWRGCSESNGKAQKYIIEPWNKATGCHANCKKNPWCAIGVASLFIQCGVKSFSKSSTCKNQKNYYKKNNRWLSASVRPYKGLVIFITGHEGFVEYTRANGEGLYWSGNCNNSWLPSKFNWKTGKAGKRKILGYGKPKY